MQLVFGPDDLEAYAVVRDRLRLHIVAWARRRGLMVEPSLVAAALDHKHSVDGRLGHWTRAHVADALAVWFPRTVALLPDDRDAVPAALHALIGFLAERDWLDSRSDPCRGPARADRPTPPRRCTTPSTTSATTTSARSGPSRCCATVCRPRTRRPWPASSNGCTQASSTSTAAALRDITRRELRGASEPPSPPQPPVLLPGAAAMLAAADSSVALARLRGFTRWVRAGRSLTRDGRLQLCDARAVAEALDLDHFARDRARAGDELPEIMLLLSWARQARFVRVVRGHLVQVKSAAPLLSRPIEMWKRAFEAVGGIGEYFGGSNVFGAPSLFGMSLGEAYPMLLNLLYAAGGDPIPVERFHRCVREAVNARMGCVVDDLAGDVEQRLWRRDVTALLDALELLGAVHLEESHADDDVAHRELVELAGRDDPDPTLVGLTPIGLWAVREMLVESGVHAPLVGELADEDIEYVCVRCVGMRREVAEAELAAWVAARPRRAAAHEVLHYLQRAEDPAHRDLALYALAQTGTGAAQPRGPAAAADRAPDRGRPATRGVRRPAAHHF